MTKKKKILIALGVISGLYIVSHMWAGNRNEVKQSMEQKADASVADTSEATEARTPPAPKKPELVVSAVELYKAFENNEAAADHQYSGKLIQVNGQIHEIHKEVSDQYSVNLSVGDEFELSHIVCNLEPRDDILKSLSKGQNVAIVGYLDGNGLTGNDVNFKDGCKVFE